MTIAAILGTKARLFWYKIITTISTFWHDKLANFVLIKRCKKIMLHKFHFLRQKIDLIYFSIWNQAVAIKVVTKEKN